MFETYKLKKYSDSIVGFAYEQSFCHVKTFLVIKKEEEITFIPYKEVFLGTKSEAGNFIDELKGQGYRTLNDFVQEKNKILNLKMKY